MISHSRRIGDDGVGEQVVPVLRALFEVRISERPAVASRDLAWLGRHTVHEGDHDLMEVRTVLAATSGIS